MKVISWNIAAGHTVKSLERFDYEDEELSYFVKQIRALEPDVICLQESHVNEQRSLAYEIAHSLGDYHVFDSPLSQSHIDPAYQASLSIITKEAFTNTGYWSFPQPEFDLYFSNGNKAVKDTKGIQYVDYNGIRIANTHALPLIVFGYDYRHGEGRVLASQVESVMSEVLGAGSVLCGDLGMSNEYERAFPSLFEKSRLKSALPKEPTHYRESEVGGLNAPDVILYTPAELKAGAAGIIQTRTDHYLCGLNYQKQRTRFHLQGVM